MGLKKSFKKMLYSTKWKLLCVCATCTFFSSLSFFSQFLSFQYSVVKFPEEIGDDEWVENVETVSSTWVSPNRTKSFWPPASIPAGRASRLATLHTKPDPATWQCLPITFVRTYREFLFKFLFMFCFSS